MNILDFFSRVTVTIPEGANIIYSRMGCKHCARAKQLLQEKNIPYEDRSVNERQHNRELISLMRKRGVNVQNTTLPQVWLDGNYIGGADDLEHFLKQAE